MSVCLSVCLSLSLSQPGHLHCLGRHRAVQQIRHPRHGVVSRRQHRHFHPPHRAAAGRVQRRRRRRVLCHRGHHHDRPHDARRQSHVPCERKRRIFPVQTHPREGVQRMQCVSLLFVCLCHCCELLGVVGGVLSLTFLLCLWQSHFTTAKQTNGHPPKPRFTACTCACGPCSNAWRS